MLSCITRSSKIRECADDAVVVSYEIEGQNNGARKFILSTWEDFWHKYWRMKKTSRVFYEVIQERRPCRLYFDLEFDISLNPRADGKSMINDFKGFIIEMIQQSFDISISKDDILDLESSSNEKFSRHLIVHTGHYFFSCNYQAGCFVKYLITQIHERKLNMMVHDKDEIKVFIDSGVYTRNRNFRLFLSSKLGKARPLMISSQSGCLPPGTKVKDGRLFRINRSEKSKRLGLWETADEADVRMFFMNSLGKHLPSKSQVCPWPLPDNISLINYREEYIPKTKNAKVICHSSAEASSEFPEYDNFMIRFVRQRSDNRNEDSKISKTVFYEDCIVFRSDEIANTLVYHFTNDRYCQRIERSHKSNGVYYLLNVKTKEVRQKCFDPDCRYYQSPPFHLNYSSNSSEVDDDLIASLEDFEKENNLMV